MSFVEDVERTEWDRAWRERPLRQLVNPVKINVAPNTDPAWGEVERVEIASDPPQFLNPDWRDSDICPVCGKATADDQRIGASLYPYFTSGFTYGLPCWVHEVCLLACAEIAGPAPVPW